MFIAPWQKVFWLCFSCFLNILETTWLFQGNENYAFLLFWRMWGFFSLIKCHCHPEIGKHLYSSFNSPYIPVSEPQEGLLSSTQLLIFLDHGIKGRWLYVWMVCVHVCKSCNTPLEFYQSLLSLSIRTPLDLNRSINFQECPPPELPHILASFHDFIRQLLITFQDQMIIFYTIFSLSFLVWVTFFFMFQ